MRVHALVVTSILVAACAKQPAAVERPSLPAAAPASSPAPTADAEGAELLAAMRTAFATCSGAEAEARAYSEGHYKAGARVSELRRSTYRTRLLWQKPNRLRGEILETDNFLVGGARMATKDGRRIRVRGAGVLGLLPLTLDVDDDLLSSNRRHGFDAQTPAAISRRLLAPTARWRAVGAGRVAGADVRLVEVGGVERLDREITREVIAVEPSVPALRGVTMYAGDRRVVEVVFTKFRWNPRVRERDFEI